MKITYRNDGDKNQSSVGFLLRLLTVDCRGRDGRRNVELWRATPGDCGWNRRRGHLVEGIRSSARPCCRHLLLFISTLFRGLRCQDQCRHGRAKRCRRCITHIRYGQGPLFNLLTFFSLWAFHLTFSQLNFKATPKDYFNFCFGESTVKTRDPIKGRKSWSHDRT